jgi:hypothetical protein
MKETTTTFNSAVFVELVLAQWLRRSPPTTPINFVQRAKAKEFRADRYTGSDLYR